MSDEECDHAGQAAAWVLGMLSPHETRRFEEHLATCESCRAEAAHLEQVADALTDSLPAERAPAEVRAQLMAAVQAEAALFRAAEQPDETPTDPPPHRRARRYTIAGIVGLSLIGAGALIGSVLVPDEKGSQVRTVAGSVTPGGGGSQARAAVLLGGDTAQLVLTDLAPPPDQRVYQAWVVRSEGAMPTGALFSVTRSGDTRISLPPLRDASQIIVTAEPPGGSSTPTPPPVVLVRLPAG